MPMIATPIATQTSPKARRLSRLISSKARTSSVKREGASTSTSPSITATRPSAMKKVLTLQCQISGNRKIRCLVISP
jgi:hypothetical protein